MNTTSFVNKTSSNPILYMIVKGQACDWMVPVCGDFAMIFKLDLMDQSGMGGDLIRFSVELRDGVKSVAAIGPHKSDVHALLKDTGLDLTDPDVDFFNTPTGIAI